MRIGKDPAAELVRLRGRGHGCRASGGRAEQQGCGDGQKAHCVTLPHRILPIAMKWSRAASAAGPVGPNGAARETGGCVVVRCRCAGVKIETQTYIPQMGGSNLEKTILKLTD